MKKIIIIFVIIIMITGGLFLSGCESCSRMGKDIKSDFNGGLERKITVYDYNGQVLKQYEGRCDIEESNAGDNKVLFDLNGKRTIIYGGIVIIDEK